ncbi:MAG: phosphoenolpyruvate--protein phosphotransferase [Deltaproteobacteria bacterium]|nr:phosphoenolpyruvate--protein phosphotransferase [Deltaproteobacteria bacterium]
MSNVVELVAKRLDADACSLYLTDAATDELTLEATIGLYQDSVSQVSLPHGEGLVGLASTTGQPVVTVHAREHDQYKYFPETGEERFESFMAVPMIVRGATIGVLAVQTIETREFDSNEVEMFQTCAQLIAPVVINARLLALVGLTDEDSSGTTAEREALENLASDREERNIEHRGIPTSRGIAIGTIYRLETPLKLERLHYTPNQDPKREVEELMDAIGEARRELDGMREKLGSKFGLDLAAVFQTHIQILEDKGFVAKLRREVLATGNALTALTNVIGTYRKTFERMSDPYFRERVNDIEDVGQRVMESLLGERHHTTPLSEGAIVVASNLLPGMFARLEVEKIAAIVSEHGGPTSHGAIFARTLEVPALTGIPGIQAAVRSGETAIVDGAEGLIILSPDEGLLYEYRRAQKRYTVAIEHLDALRDRPAETRDGRSIRLTANVGLVSDLRLVNQHGADGIGLFRTEMLAFAHRGFPGEEEQTQLYERVAKSMAPRTVTIRTLDLGGDKEMPDVSMRLEDNPQLGCRSIRLSLANQGIFKAQLRAIYRASAAGNIRLMLPMVTSIDELRSAKVLIAEVLDDLKRAGIPYDENVPLGLMIEVPSAAITADVLARECDFFSIGTNDLTQYTLAVDRGNEHVAHIYDPLHPAVLSLIDASIRAASRANIPISVCGEMASNPLAVPLLVGLGIQELSSAPSAVPLVKEIIRELDFGDLEADVRKTQKAGTAAEVHQIGAARLRDAGLLEHPDIGPWLQTLIDKALLGH